MLPRRVLAFVLSAIVAAAALVGAPASAAEIATRGITNSATVRAGVNDAATPGGYLVFAAGAVRPAPGSPLASRGGAGALDDVEGIVRGLGRELDDDAAAVLAGVRQNAAERGDYGLMMMADDIGPIARFGDDYELYGQLVEDGVLELAIRSGEGAARRGTSLFNEAIEHFGSRVRAVRGRWQEGTNLEQFWENLAAGMDPVAAARNTWTGRRAASHGFTAISNVEFLPEDAIRVLFSRP